ncbi:MAG: 2-amino-4-hydroxy-6-hydroxymethyldihydropteridine diphosphokinase [Burkholderiales bacterium]|nr:2-amino-4-hydroxy-6-hydroxymethyldihydropteridine diphosphokinase [Burkholderiales bacterium]
MARAFVGLGANLGDPARQIAQALDAIGRLPGTRVVRSSSLYRTAPVGYAAQPDFLNAVAEIETGLAPRALLAALQKIEADAGRERAYRNAPRLLDLDLLLYDGSAVREPGLELPHPRMHERAFVLAPLVEIAPHAEIPGRGGAAALLAAVAGQRVEKL